MFLNHCSACDKSMLIFPSRITSLANTEHGIVVHFACWCGSEQTMLTGRTAEVADAPALVA